MFFTFAMIPLLLAVMETDFNENRNDYTTMICMKCPYVTRSKMYIACIFNFVPFSMESSIEVCLCSNWTYYWRSISHSKPKLIIHFNCVALTCRSVFKNWAQWNLLGFRFFLSPHASHGYKMRPAGLSIKNFDFPFTNSFNLCVYVYIKRVLFLFFSLCYFFFVQFKSIGTMHGMNRRIFVIYLLSAMVP